MKNTQESEYIEISITKMLIAVFKNIKTFMVVVVLGLVVTAFVASMWKPTYTYQQMIQSPSYISDKGQVSVIDNNSLSSILENIIANAQQSNPDNGILSNVDVIAPTKADSKDPTRVFFAISTQAKYSSKDQVKDELDKLVVKFSKSEIIKNQVKLWELNIKQKIADNEKKLTRYEGVIKKNQEYLQGLSSQKRLSGIDGQILLSSYISRIDNYQKAVFNIEDSQNALQLKLKSLKTDLTTFGNMTYSKSSKFSVVTLSILGVLFSFFVASLVVFLKVLIIRSLQDYKNDVAN